MTTPRFDLYSDFHKGLRTMMFDFTVAAGRGDYDEERTLGELRTSYEFILGVITEHTEHENTFLHPALAKVDPELAARFDGEHGDHVAALQAMADDLASIAADSADAVQRGNAFYRRFSAWMGEFLVHMNEEETVIMPALQAHYTDEQLIGISVQLRATVAPDRMGMYLSKMIPAMNAAEREAMFQGMRLGAPPEVFEGTLQLAEQVLPRPSFRRLSRSLAQSA